MTTFFPIFFDIKEIVKQILDQVPFFYVINKLIYHALRKASWEHASISSLK